MHYPMNPTDREHWSPRPNIRNAYRSMVPLAANGPWSQALGPTHFSWMFLNETPKGLPTVTLPEVWFVYRTNPAISFWDTEGPIGDHGALSVCRRVGLHARRDQPHGGHPAAGCDRPGEPAADPHRRLQVHRAVLGARGLRAAPAGGRGAGRGARFHRHRHRTRAPHRPAGGIQRLDQPRRGRRAAQGRELGFFPGSQARPRPRRDLGRRVQARQRRVERRQRGARPRLVEGARPRHQAVPARRLVSVPDAGCARAAFRDAVPGAPVPHRQGTRQPAARARHAVVGQAARRVSGAAAVEGFSGPVGEIPGEDGRQDRRIFRSGCSPRAACSIPGATTSASS